MTASGYGLRAAVAFWERGRIVYNALLVVIVLMVFKDHLGQLTAPQSLMGLATLGIVANLLYCLAYPIDLALQLTRRHEILRGGRLGLLIAGIVGGAFVAWIVALAVLAPLSGGAPF